MSRRKQRAAGDGDSPLRANADEPRDDEGLIAPDSRPWTAEEYEVLRTAYLYANYEELSQRDIAEYLGVSAPTVARRLKEARNRGWLFTSVQYRPPAYARDMARYFGDPRLQYALTSALKSEDLHDRLQRVEVIPSAGTPDKSRERCASVVARMVEKALRAGSHVLACNWGRTTEAIGRALRPATENPDLEVVPIFGDLGVDPRDPQFAEAHKYYANQVAELIAERFGASIPARLTFKAFIPLDIQQEDLEVIRRYVRADVSYQIVFGVEDDQGRLIEEGHIHRAGTILSGLGAIEKTNPWFQYAGVVSGVDISRLRKHIVGDIAQHFVTIEGVDAGLPEELEDVAVMNSRVVGLTPQHLQDVARKCANGSVEGLGVVIVAGGAHKAEVTLAAVRSGVVNRLIAGQDLAEALLARLQ